MRLRDDHSPRTLRRQSGIGATCPSSPVAFAGGLSSPALDRRPSPCLPGGPQAEGIEKESGPRSRAKRPLGEEQAPRPDTCIAWTQEPLEGASQQVSRRHRQVVVSGCSSSPNMSFLLWPTVSLQGVILD